MRIFDETKTYELSPETIDSEKGWLRADKKFVMHHEEVLAKEAVYMDRSVKHPNGSISVYKDLVTPAVEAKDAYDEYEDIYVYVPYTTKQLAERQIAALKAKLTETDYQAIKYAEGELSDAEYAEIKNRRRAWRNTINALEAMIAEGTWQ